MNKNYIFNNIKGYTHSEKPVNQDGYFMNDKLLMVLDGATGLGENNLLNLGDDTKWFVQNIIDNFSKNHESIPIEELLISIVKELQKVYPVKDYLSIPSACIIIARIIDNELEVFAFGDTLLLVEDKTGKIEAHEDENLNNLDKGVLSEIIKLRKEKNISILEGRHTKEIIKLLEENRVKRNKENGYYNIDLTLDWVGHQYYKKYNLDTINRIALMSDGFSKIMEYDYYNDYKELLDDLENDNHKVEQALIDIENEDYLCNKFPRFAKSDDATYVFAKIDYE